MSTFLSFLINVFYKHALEFEVEYYFAFVKQIQKNVSLL